MRAWVSTNSSVVNSSVKIFRSAGPRKSLRWRNLDGKPLNAKDAKESQNRMIEATCWRHGYMLSSDG
jgi:hypothetical protein